MLDEAAIRRRARELGVRTDYAEKDYVNSWVLYGIYTTAFGDDLLFKGGTALSKLYFPETWRFSEDLDFTVDGTFTCCANCGAIACNSHTKTERLEGDPVCTGCAVTERFALKTKYFYDEENLEAFREEYADMTLHEKAMENKLLAGGSVVATLLLVVGLLVIGGIM